MTDTTDPKATPSPDALPPQTVAKWIGIGVGAGIGSAAVAAALLYAGGKRQPDKAKRKR